MHQYKRTLAQVKQNITILWVLKRGQLVAFHFSWQKLQASGAGSNMARFLLPGRTDILSIFVEGRLFINAPVAHYFTLPALCLLLATSSKSPRYRPAVPLLHLTGPDSLNILSVLRHQLTHPRL